MKKLRLKALSLGAREILSREQLKSVTGGCTTDSDCAVTAYCYYGTCTDPITGSGSGSGSGSPSETCTSQQVSCPDGSTGYIPQVWVNGACTTDPYYTGNPCP